MSDASKRAVVVKYEGRGLLGGFAIGFILGALVSGPQLRNWPLWQSLLVVLGGGAIGALLGYLAIWMAAGSAAGASPGASIGDGGSGNGGDGGGGDGGDA